MRKTKTKKVTKPAPRMVMVIEKIAGRIDAREFNRALRHTVGTLLTEAGVNLDTVRRWLGQKTLAMAIFYSDTADTSKQMRGAMNKLDPLGSKARTKVSNKLKKVSNRGK